MALVEEVGATRTNAGGGSSRVVRLASSTLMLKAPIRIRSHGRNADGMRRSELERVVSVIMTDSLLSTC